MRFLADENFRLDVMRFLRSKGHDVKRITSRSSDKEVAVCARKEKRILLTNDSDFSIKLKFPPSEYPGILVFHIHPPSLEKFKLALTHLFTIRDPNEIKGKTFIIEEEGFVLEIE